MVQGDEIVVRQMMKVALSADHRVTDGAQGARFIKEIAGPSREPGGTGALKLTSGSGSRFHRRYSIGTGG